MQEPPTNHAFIPATNLQQFKRALGRYATGVAVITAKSADGPIGITANSFASISLSPALIMWAPDKASARHDAFVAADAFAIHVLSFEQKAVCDAFARSRSAFEDCRSTANHHGVPIITDCLAVFECTRFATHDAGDHTIILGEVHTAHERAGPNLIFANGAFTRMPNAGDKG